MMKAIPYLVSGLSWFFIFNAVAQFEAAISGEVVALSLILAFISAGWLAYRSESKAKAV